MSDTIEPKRKSANVEVLDPHAALDDIDDDDDADDDETASYHKPRDSGSIDPFGFLTNRELGEE